jgi:hypothetical protein
MTPLGVPVVPDVKTITASGSDGCVQGRVRGIAFREPGAHHSLMVAVRARAGRSP